MARKFIIILAIGLFSQLSFAQDFDKAKLDKYFDALEANNKFMGSVALSKQGKIIYTKTIGFADVENNIKAKINSKYRIGSISKTFTAVLVFKAFENGKINLNQTINKYFPTIKNADKITIKHLLYHRSGIPSFTNDKSFFTWNTQAKTQKEMVEIISKSGSDFEPDSKAEYSNSNYVLLTYILEKSFNKSYSDLLTEHITKPIGLANTYLGSKINTNENECKSYQFMGDWSIVSETDISIPLGAGGIVSTPSDLVMFSDALFSGKIIKAENLEQMKTLKENYGIGLFAIPFQNYKSYGHTGGIDGFTSIFSHFTDKNISFAMTSNGTNYDNNDISIAVLSAVFNKPYTIPEFKTYFVESEVLDKYLGVYSSTTFPLKITITKGINTVIAQASGQSPITLEATEKDIFTFIQADLTLEFNPKENTMTLKQGGQQFVMKKE